MPQSSYAYAVARIRALENKLLGRDKIERMLDVDTAEDVLKILIESEYGGGSDIANPQDYEALLSAELRKAYELIIAVTPDIEGTNLFLLQYDIHNLKVLMKSRILEDSQDELLRDRGIVPLEVLKNAVLNKDYRMLPSQFRQSLEELDNQLSLKVDPQKIDVVLDRMQMDWIFDVIKKRQGTFLEKLFTSQVDLVNIRTLLRVKKMKESFDFLKVLLIPYGRLESSFYERAMEETLEQLVDRTAYGPYGKVIAEGVQGLMKQGNLTVYERYMDNFVIDFVKKHKSNPFGIEAIIGYLIGKENEIKLVRMIMVGKTNNISNDKIRERLRDVYV